MAELNIVIPSYKRWDSLPGYDYFPSSKIVIPESQADLYIKKAGRDSKRFIVIPDDADGMLTKKRNWILKNVPRPLVMLDDDVDKITMCEGGEYFKRYGRAKQCIPLTSEQAEDVLRQIANLAYMWGCPMFGVNCNTDGRNYQQYKPFSLTQVINGPCQGHLEHDLLYDEKMELKEDYDMSLQMLNKYKKILRANKYAYNAKHGDNKGGSAAFRTMEREIEACKAIEKKWGTKLIHYNIDKGRYSGLLNGIMKVPIKGV